MSIHTVKVSNVSLSATEQDIKEFFSFSGDIKYVEMKSENEWAQIAYITFKDSQGAENALFLSGTTIVDLSITITPALDYQLPPAASAPPAGMQNKVASGAESSIHIAEDVGSSIHAEGFTSGKDTLNKKDRGLIEKISMGTSIVNDKVREMDQKLLVSEKTKSAFAVAEQYVVSGASWVTGAFNKVAQAAGEVGQKAKEKVSMSTEEEERRGTVDVLAQIHLSELLL